jgi:maleate isomerase
VTHHRIGLIVPSSNVTVETEMPRLLGRHETATFSFHSSRMRMHTVSEEELRAMNAQRDRCVDEIADTGADAVLYACLVALMAQGHGEHHRAESAVGDLLRSRDVTAKVTSSAGALVTALRALDARRIGLVMPYMKPIARLVVDYLAAEGFDVVAWTALEVADNAEVGRVPADRVRAAARGLDLGEADALVISACVQMPSLDLVADAEAEMGLPVISAATAGAFTLLDRLGLPADIRGAGRLLARATAMT